MKTAHIPDSDCDDNRSDSRRAPNGQARGGVRGIVAAATRSPARSAIAPSPLDVFALRCWARATLYAACVLDLHEAVDVLQADAEASGLVRDLGQNEVQKILANAFHSVARGRL